MNKTCVTCGENYYENKWLGGMYSQRCIECEFGATLSKWYPIGTIPADVIQVLKEEL